MNKVCGIYKITSPTNKVYIGQSTNILFRFRAYKRLNCKKHSEESKAKMSEAHKGKTAWNKGLKVK